jgi:hypothetical protein
MPLPNITFIQSPNGLGRPLTGTDYISGHLHYYASGATLPTGFTSSDRIKKVFSVADAEALGITDAHLGETKAVAKLVIGGTPAVGDTVAITYTGIDGVETVLSTYTMVLADVTSTTTAAAALKAAINLGTNTHGFTADNTTNSLFITTKGGEGIFPNSGTPYASTITGGTTGTWTQPTGSGSTVLGVASWIDTLHYHISEYFRIQPKGELYVGLYEEESTTYTFAAITTMQNFAQGAIKQIDVFEKNVAFSSAQATALQAIAAANAAVYKPLQIVLNAEISGTASVATLTDLSTLTAPKVSVSIAQDGAGTGYHIYKATGKSVGIGGAMLGAISFASVSDSIAWIQKFNMASGGTELDTIAFANGQLYTALADSQFQSLNNYAYVFLVKHIGITGSYFSDSKTTVISTSDYSTIENNRVYDKVTRVVRAALLPSLSGPLKVNADGTLNLDTIGFFESLANQPLIQMEADNELSAHKVIINPTQNVLSTSTLELTIQLVPIGVARFIEVNVGFVVSVA